MRADIKIQSVSDIITNSSSEIFMIVKADDADLLKDIYNYLFGVLDNDKYSDSDTYIKALDWNLNDKNSPEILVSAPYGISQTDFIEKAIKTMIEQKFANKTEKIQIVRYDDY